MKKINVALVGLGQIGNYLMNELNKKKKRHRTENRKKNRYRGDFSKKSK